MVVNLIIVLNVLKEDIYIMVNVLLPVQRNGSEETRNVGHVTILVELVTVRKLMTVLVVMMTDIYILDNA